MSINELVYNVEQTFFEGMKLYRATTVKDFAGVRHNLIVQPRLYAFTRMIGEVFVYERLKTNKSPVSDDIRQYIKDYIRN